MSTMIPDDGGWVAGEAEARGYTFRREGEYWTITRPGVVIRLTVGLHLLARLLGQPDREFAAVDLAGGGESHAAWSDAGEVLDRRAMAGYRVGSRASAPSSRKRWRSTTAVAPRAPCRD